MNQQKIFVFFILLQISIIFVNTQQYYNNGPASYRNQTWMSLLDFGLPLRQISMIGTHNSVGFQNCFWLGSFQQCQYNSLNVQLQSGIRALDIRVKHNNDLFQAYDRSCSLGYNLAGILDAVTAFLSSYPSETVLLHLVQQQSPSGCTRTFEDTFKFYRDSYPGFIWVPTTQDPVLGQVRGKIVILQQFSSIQIHGLLWATFKSLPNKVFGSNWDLHNKWMDVKNFLNNANTAKKSMISYWTGHGSSYPYFVASGKSSNGNGDPRLLTGYVTSLFSCCKYPQFPRIACALSMCSVPFEGVNIFGYNYIASQNFAYTGISFLDFYGDELVKLVIGKNTRLYPKCTLTQVSQGCALCSFSGVCLKCNFLLNYVYDPVNLKCLAKTGYYLNASYFPISCSTPMPGCLQCTDQFTCLRCDQINHYLLDNAQCIAEPGYYLDINNNLISVQCPQIGCDQCLNQTVCVVCSDATNYIFDNSGIACQCNALQHFVQAPAPVISCICQLMYFLSSNNTCEPMPKCPDPYNGCLNCSASNICLQCDTANHFISDPATNTHCICALFYYYNGTGCELCNILDAACDQCANQLLCLSCVNNFTLVKGVCQCSPLYYQVDNDTCNLCTTGCLKCTGIGACTLCDPTNFFVLVFGYCTCDVGRFQQNGQCLLCNQMAGCVDCNNTGCILCDSIFQFILENATLTCICSYGLFINDMNICQQCQMQGCLNCLDQPYCIECNTTLYYLNTTTHICDDICGDGNFIYVQCDDGNLIDGDGCSSTCTIQKDFTCLDGNITTPSVCSYSGPIYLQIQSTIKDQTKNKVQITFKIQPVLLAFQTLNFSTVIFPQFSYQTKKATYDSSKGIITMDLTYNQSLNAKTPNQLQVTFQPPTLMPEFYYMKASSMKLPQVTDNNLALKYYDESIYDLFQIIKTLSNAITFVYIGVFLVCFIFISKLIAIELILVPQVTYAGLVMIEKLQSLLLPLSNLRYSNGYNTLFSDSVQIPPRISILQYQCQLLSNFNLNLILIFVTLIVGLVLFAIGKFMSNKKVSKWSYNALKEWTFCILLLFQFQLIIAFGIDFLFNPNMIGKVIGGLLMVSFFVMIFLLYKKPANFGQFKKFFVQQPRHLNHYIFVVIIRFLLSGTLIFLSSLQACGFIAIGIVVINIIYLIICRPYLDNFRPIMNLVVLVLILGIQSYYKLNFYSEQATFLSTYLPLAILILLIILLFANVIFAILHFKNKSKKQTIQKFQIAVDQTFDEEMKKQLEKQMKVISQIHMALSPSNLNNLTERQERDLPTKRTLLANNTNANNTNNQNKQQKQQKSGQKELKKIKNMLKLNQLMTPLGSDSRKLYEEI